MDNFALQVLCVLVLSAATFAVALLRRRPLSPSPSPSLPPSPPGLLIIGHLHLLRGMPHHTLAKLARKLGPIIHLRLGQVNTVAISSSDLAELVLKTHDPIFSSRPQIVGAQYLSFGCSDVTFSPYGPYWRQARKICVTELLSSKRVGSFQFIRSEEVTRMLSTISGQAGLEIDLSELFFNLANDVLCRVAFGRRFIEGSEERKGRDLAGVLKETQELLAGFCVGEFFPEWRWVNCLSGMRRRLEKNLGNLRDVCDEIIREHLERREKSGEEREDFVDVLLRVQKRVDLEVPITDDNLKALVLDMFVAGTDTTSSTLEWTMTQLARHPTVLKKAQEEVRRTAATKGMVEEGDLHHLRYLKAVIQETMRLNPPVPLLVPRESMEDCILKGYKIPAKTRVLINTYAIGRDPESWRDPLEFNPERFMEEEIDFKGQDYRFLPFGGGRRGCPGFAFGLATVQITLARLLFHFDWALPHGLKADNLDMEEIFGLATRKKTALVLVPSISSDSGSRGNSNL